MDGPGGRREVNKRATRSALRRAARALFHEQGFDATSVREIAARAGVGERTFYRYFETKEDLISDELDRWLELVGEAVRAQPPGLEPFPAVRAALAGLAEEINHGVRDPPIWAAGDGANPYAVLQRAGSRPLLRFEAVIADALVARAATGAEPVPRFRAEVVARVAVAVVRSIVIRRRELELAGETPVPTLAAVAAEAMVALEAALPETR
ncbi:MAG TPA: TetR family transcriptional regulator [Solirubrobacteraceae bacterium]|nr:TetR family transcriptional regulator [Solirubrobacteraceae bacterium]